MIQWIEKKIVENLKDYKVHENAIDVIVDTCTGDKTTLEYENENKTKMNISSGIKQGCTGFTTIFKFLFLTSVFFLYSVLE